MRRWAVVAALLALLVVAAGCGGMSVVHEPSVTVSQTPAQSSGAPERPHTGVGVRIDVVTHGQASSPFWAIVRNGAEAAGRQMDVVVNYRAPDVYSLERMEDLIDRAIADRPDGLVVSIPELGLAPSIRKAVRAGIPVVSINSGSDIAARLGVLAHVGQPEERAGFEAGERLAASGARSVLCVNQQVGNQGLDDRCDGLQRALRARGGRARVLAVDDMDPDTAKRIAAAVKRDDADAILALNSTSGLEAVQAVTRLGKASSVRVATFDLGPDVLTAVRAGKIMFAVDQQAYLQGYLPVVLLTERARYGVFPGHGDVIPTGPNFVTRDQAQRVMDLSKRSIR